jgi:hypothetical protein
MVLMTLRFCALTFFILFQSLNGFAAPSLIQNDFVTDGCTGFVNGTYAQPDLWLHCCVQHDLHFWAGGTWKMRNETDLQLRDCVAETGAREIANLMYLGVHLGGYSPIKLSDMGWGNAWGKKKAYRQLTSEEVQAIEADLKNYDLTEKMKQTLRNSLEAGDQE